MIWNVLSLVVGTVVSEVGTVTVTNDSSVPGLPSVTAVPPAVGPPALVPPVTPGGREVETPLTGGHVNSVQSCFITGSVHTKSERDRRKKKRNIKRKKKERRERGHGRGGESG